MQAVVMTQVGGPEVLEYKAIPEPQISTPNQVKVKIRAAGINPIDTKVRRAAMFYPDALPAVLGCDLAGEIVELGSAVKQFKLGDKVWACHGGLGNEQGNYAEYNVIAARWLALMPSTATFTTAAAAPLVLITAWGALFERGALQAGETVLIHAGAGGVGHVAIQLAKLKGARVISTVSNEQKASLAKSLGADEVILYTQEDVAKRVQQLTDDHGVDLVFDTIGGTVFTQSIQSVAYFGRIVTLLDPGLVDLANARLRNLQISFELMLTPMLRHLDQAREQHIKILQHCAALIDKGQLVIHIAHTLPLSEAQQAHIMLEQGHSTGKTVLEI